MVLVPPTATATAPAQLPAEIILEIVEHVPIDYILDWRLVARGIRDAIDGRILHHHLQRAELIGYLGTRSTGAMPLVGDSHYERLSLMRARFGHMQDCVDDDGNNNHNSDNDQDDGPRRVPPRKAIWACLHAVFRIEEDWLQAFGDACRRLSEKQTMAGVAALWEYIQQRLEWPRADQGLWAVRWCLRLDHAVLDLGLPLDAGKHCGTLDLDLQQGTVRIAWYDLLRDFLKSESAFRRLFAKARKNESKFTYGHVEDCLRAIRRRRLQESLDPQDKIDRHITWSLRLLPPLFGRRRDPHTVPLEEVENQAMALLLQLRREASMTARQVAYLKQLAAEYRSLEQEICALDEAFRQFKHHLTLADLSWTAIPTQNTMRLPCNPITWTDAVIVEVEELVSKRRSQKKIMDQLELLLTASNVAMALPQTSFENIDEDF